MIHVAMAGGGLEDFDPANTWFGTRFHLVYVAVNGKAQEFQVIDEHGRLFDVMTLTENPDRGSR